MQIGDPVAELTQQGLEDEVTNLRLLADRLEAFGAGDDEAWTANDALAGHHLLVRVQAHAAGVRSLRAAVARHDAVVPLEERR